MQQERGRLRPPPFFCVLAGLLVASCGQDLPVAAFAGTGPSLDPVRFFTGSVRSWGVHAITSLLPSTVLHRAAPPRPLAAVYRTLRRLDAALASTPPARALSNSLVILAERAQPSA